MDLRRRNLDRVDNFKQQKTFYAVAKENFLCQFDCRLENEIVCEDCVEYCITDLTCPISDLSRCKIPGLRFDIIDGRVLAVFTRVPDKKQIPLIEIGYLIIFFLTVVYVYVNFNQYMEVLGL